MPTHASVLEAIRWTNYCTRPYTTRAIRADVLCVHPPEQLCIVDLPSVLVPREHVCGEFAERGSVHPFNTGTYGSNGVIISIYSI